MSMVRIQGRPKRGPFSVGRDKIIGDALQLLRSGKHITTRKKLSADLGITPALLNYYFGKDANFLKHSIVDAIEGRGKPFNLAAERYLGGYEAALDDALLALCQMHLSEKLLIHAYVALYRISATDCPLKNMKDLLKTIILHHLGEKCPNTLEATTNIVWSACSSVTEESCIPFCVSSARRFIALHAPANENDFQTASRCIITRVSDAPTSKALSRS